MEPEAHNELAHIDTPISDPPDASFFTATQWRVWYALMDTIIPSIVPKGKEHHGTGEYAFAQDTVESYFQYVQNQLSSPPSREDFETYLSEKPSDIPAFKDHMIRTLHGLPKDLRDQLGSMLTMLG